MKHVWNTIAVILVVAVVAIAAADASAGPNQGSKALMMRDTYGRAGNFSVTARYLGTFEGEIYVGGRRVRVPADTPVYVVGRGIQDQGYFSNDAVVYVTGVRRGGAAVAKMIVVRPGDGQSMPARSGATAVGEYADDVPN